MKQILTVILRNQFNLFYRFGYTYIPKAFCIEFENLTAESTQKYLLKLFSSITPFEYDEEYLILHLDTDRTPTDEIYHFDIQNIVAVYPFSQQAKVSIESRIDQRIKLENPFFENVLQSVDDEIVIKEQTKAIEALWHLCGFTEQVSDYISKIGKENVSRGMKDRKNGIKANEIREGNYWEYLLAYDRYDYFPNSTLGYFYDAGQVFAYSKGKQTFEGSDLYKCLEEIQKREPEIKMNEIIKALETNEIAKGYISQTTDDSIKQYVVAPLFLLLRDEIRKADDIYQTSLFKNQNWLKQEFSDNFKYVIILLGAFFGFRKFYDAYYDSLNLRFYKAHINDPVPPPENTLTNYEAEKVFEELSSECKAVKRSKQEYIRIIQKYGFCEDILTALRDGIKGKPVAKNVIVFFQKKLSSKNNVDEKMTIDELSIFDNIEDFDEETKKILKKNLKYVVNKHRDGLPLEINNAIKEHFMNLCADRNNKYPKNKVPDFQKIEEKTTSIMDEKYPNN